MTATAKRAQQDASPDDEELDRVEQDVDRVLDKVAEIVEGG
jgi:hypothetical protein